MIYTFGECVLDTQLHLLTRAGKPINLRPKAFESLLYLLIHRNQVVQKQELCEQIWPEQFISDATLGSTLRTVRQALGDSGGTQHIIQTVHGYGYRFVATVTVHDEGATEPTIVVPSAQVLDAPLPEGALYRDTPSQAALPTALASNALLPLSEVLPGERKLVTVLCCALTDTARVLAQHGLDTLHSLMRALYEHTQASVPQYGGTIISSPGDRVLVVFGAPVAQEDQAVRSVLAALALQHRLREWPGQSGVPMEERETASLSLHTGPVAIGGLGPRVESPPVLVGDVTTIAMALQEQANAGTILCSATTARLVQGVVHVESISLSTMIRTLGSAQVYTVLGRKPRQAPLARYPGRPMSRFVNRQRELGMLHALLAQVESGRGHAIGVQGEPGIGKSRLLYEFRQSLQGNTLTYLQGRCLSYGMTTPYLPVVDFLRHHCGLTETDGPAVVTAKVAQRLDEAQMASQEWAPYLLQLLGVSVESPQIASLSPQALKTRTFATLIQMCINCSRQRPLLIEVEDLQWSDATSEEFLLELAERIGELPILLLGIYRPGYRPAWLNLSHATQIGLSRLTPDDSLQVIHAVPQTIDLSTALTQEILRKADGNPFFLEELAYTVAEQDTAQTLQHVPDTIQAVLAARIDRLPLREKRVLQMAAVIGKDIPLSLLQVVVSLPGEQLQQSLRTLQMAEFLYEARTIPNSLYTFKHVLIQEVAYQSLLRSVRQPYHDQIARALSEYFPDVITVQPALLAYHYTAAALPEAALPWWQRAGEHAVERSANVEAISHFAQALALLQTLPVTPTRIQQELTLQLAIGSPLMMLKSHTAPEVEQVYTRAYALATQLGDRRQRFAVLAGLWRFYLSQAELRTAREMADQCFAIAQDLGESMPLQEAHIIVGSTLYFLGELLPAAAHLEQGLALSTHQAHHTLAHSRATAPSVVCLSRMAWVLWHLGYPDRALAQSHAALALARQLSHTYSLAFAMQYHALMHLWIRQAATVQDLLESTIAFMEEHGFVYFRGAAVSRLGWVLVEQGAIEEGIQHIREGLESDRTYGVGLGRHESLALLAQAYGKAGQVSAGLRTLEEALTLAQANDEGHWEAELYRLKGELLLQSGTEHVGVGPPSDTQASALSLTREAEDCFQHAIGLARHKSARSMELRAVMSLSHLWHRQGKSAHARQLLATTYRWFTEGFETPDLQAAQSLLVAWQ